MRCLFTACAVSPRSHRQSLQILRCPPGPRTGVPMLAALALALLPSLAYAQGDGGLATGACCISGGGIQQCQQVIAAECESLGGTFSGVGSSCTPAGGCPSTAPTGACCVPGTCFTATEADCLASGGTFNGAGSSCDPFPCQPPATGACCLEDASFCLETTSVTCDLLDGTFHANQTCGSLKCGEPPPPPPPTGACCVLTINGFECQIASAAICAALNGAYSGDGSTCGTPGQPTCDPGSGPTGACCVAGGGLIQCTVVRESICTALGGTFQGEGSSCAGLSCVPGDTNNDGDVNVTDLLTVISTWGPCPSGAAASCPGDLDRTNVVNVNDLLLVLSNWGA